MAKTVLNIASPVFASAGLYGVDSSKLGMALLVIMALAVIANQLWTIFEKVRRSIRSPESDTSGLASTELCEQRHQEIERLLAGLRKEDERQDRINKEQFGTISAALVELRHEMREDVKGLHKRSDDVLRAVSRLEGKVN